MIVGCGQECIHTGRMEGVNLLEAWIRIFPRLICHGIVATPTTQSIAKRTDTTASFLTDQEELGLWPLSPALLFSSFVVVAINRIKLWRWWYTITAGLLFRIDFSCCLGDSVVDCSLLVVVKQKAASSKDGWMKIRRRIEVNSVEIHASGVSSIVAMKHSWKWKINMAAQELVLSGV